MDRHDLVLDSISAVLSSQISCSAAVDLIFRYAIEVLGYYVLFLYITNSDTFVHASAGSKGLLLDLQGASIP